MKKPIGIFDSGFGGLTVLRAVSRLLPNEDIIYFGDTAHVPYGSKSKEAVTSFSLAIADFLIKKRVKLLVVACNTASAFALPALTRRYSIPTIGVIRPGAEAAVESTRNNRIGIIGTEGTIRSSSYTSAIHSIDRTATVFAKACPLFVPLVEEGWVNHPVTRQVAKEYLHALVQKKIDTLVLGCTHYPLLKSVIRRVIDYRITLIDSAESTAEAVSQMLKRHRLSKAGFGQGTHEYFVSDAPEKFKSLGRRFLGFNIPRVQKVTLEHQ